MSLLTEWEVNRQNEIDTGGRCRQCEALIVFPKGAPSLCPACKDMLSPDPVDHPRRIRCPRCRALMDPHADPEDLADLFLEGVHEVVCQSCEHEFDVTTTVSYTFGSPEVLDPDPDEIDRDETR